MALCMTKDAHTQRPIGEFNQNLFTLEQVRDCLENTDPNGMTWFEYCNRNNYTVEDMLRPLQIQHDRSVIATY